jgi:glycosyltransferase involved in cell wall biosynthesis
MKIAVISIISEPWGGSEELWADMADCAIKMNHTLIHSTYNFNKLSEKEEKLIKKGLIVHKRIGYIRSDIHYLKRISIKIINFIKKKLSNPFSELINQHPDYILYNGTCYSIVNEKYLLKAISQSRIPFGIIAHYNSEDGQELENKKTEKIRSIFNIAKHIFFVSKRTLENAERKINSKLTNAFVIRNPVNLTDLTIVDYPTTYPANMAMVGNLVTIHKGQDTVLHILSEDKWKKRNWRLNIYGSGYDEQKLKQLTQSLQLTDRVTFHGKVHNIRKVWSENHILLMPSKMEGMPLAVVEAMLCGRPSVVTDVGGHKEWIDENIEGWIANDSNAEKFQEAMEKAWDNIDRWEEAGKLAHKKAMRLYDPNAGETLLQYILNNS